MAVGITISRCSATLVEMSKGTLGPRGLLSDHDSAALDCGALSLTGRQGSLV